MNPAPRNLWLIYRKVFTNLSTLAVLGACDSATGIDQPQSTTQTSTSSSSDADSGTGNDPTFVPVGFTATASLTITRADWNISTLKIRGTAGKDVTVSIFDAARDVLLGNTTTRRSRNGDYTWAAEFDDLDIAPCRVRAITRNQSIETAVDGAPQNCTVITGSNDDGGSSGGSTGGGTGGGTLNTSHADKFSVYEGSKTCAQCHAAEVSEVHATVHYQLNGASPYVTNMTRGGKLGGINDYCGFPDINFIGQMTNLDGAVVDGGCAQCHAGLGAKPTATATQAQLDNIDCLMCHSESYRRKVEKQADNTFRFVPAPEKMTVPLLQAITDIQRTPSKGNCVNCHAFAGGGNNNKRGDIENAHRNPPSAAFDVHMALTSVGGAGLSCVSCHQTAAHKIAGRGVDLPPTDLNVAVRCTNCHAATPHSSARLNKHVQRVDCSVCHIPAFARIASTDMVRDYSKPAVVDAAKRLYEPAITRGANVTPEYRFWNGCSTIYAFGTPAVPGSSGRVSMAEPVGDIKDPAAKLFAFKHHLAVQPRAIATKYLLPLKSGILFQTGNIDGAIKQGALEVGWDLSAGYEFVNTERWQGIFHEVAPASNALSCTACHNGTRINFAALGYTPLTTRNGKPLCTSCHGDESGEWSGSELFTRVHAKHVDDERITCSSCHTS